MACQTCSICPADRSSPTKAQTTRHRVALTDRVAVLKDPAIKQKWTMVELHNPRMPKTTKAARESQCPRVYGRRASREGAGMGPEGTHVGRYTLPVEAASGDMGTWGR